MDINSMNSFQVLAGEKYPEPDVGDIYVPNISKYKAEWIIKPCTCLSMVDYVWPNDKWSGCGPHFTRKDNPSYDFVFYAKPGWNSIDWWHYNGTLYSKHKKTYEYILISIQLLKDLNSDGRTHCALCKKLLYEPYPNIRYCKDCEK